MALRMPFNITFMLTLPVLFYLELSTSENYLFQTPILCDVAVGYKQYSTFILYDTDFSILYTKFNLFLRALWKEACQKDEIFFQPGDGIYIAGYHL
jgi:hypothetical protein